MHGVPSPGGLVTEGSIVAVEGVGTSSMFNVQVCPLVVTLCRHLLTSMIYYYAARYASTC
jgi:hypothetical protein